MQKVTENCHPSMVILWRWCLRLQILERIIVMVFDHVDWATQQRNRSIIDPHCFGLFAMPGVFTRASDFDKFSFIRSLELLAGLTFFKLMLLDLYYVIFPRWRKASKVREKASARAQGTLSSGKFSDQKGHFMYFWAQSAPSASSAALPLYIAQQNLW